MQVFHTLKLRPEHCRKGNFSPETTPGLPPPPVALSPLPHALVFLPSAPGPAPRLVSKRRTSVTGEEVRSCWETGADQALGGVLGLGVRKHENFQICVMLDTFLHLDGPQSPHLRSGGLCGIAGLQQSWHEIDTSCSPDAPIRDPQPEEDKEMDSWVRILPCPGTLHRLVNKLHP